MKTRKLINAKLINVKSKPVSDKEFKKMRAENYDTPRWKRLKESGNCRDLSDWAMWHGGSEWDIY